jgi:hypothetical protein
MFPRMAELGLVFLVSACAGANKNTRYQVESRANSPGLFVGHSESGDVVVASTHYLAMSGLATTDTDLGLPARKGGSGEMQCRREMLTGTHVPHWVCRYQEDVDAGREHLRTLLEAPRLSVDRSVIAPAITVRAGPGTRVPLP